MQFNESQKTAVDHLNGPMMVLAGPGSGKTAVITGRAARLIERGIKPSEILAVTFTKAAARQMKERFLAILQVSSTEAVFGTFHGVFYGILKNSMAAGSLSVLGEQKKLALLKDIINQSYPEADRETDLPQQTAKEISQMKGSGIPPEHFYSTVLPQDVFSEVCRIYEEWKTENGKIDFDDIILKCRDLLKESPDILHKWQGRFHYFLIDEFQDISPMQYEIIRLLAEPRNNLFIVGDDDQSIYRFRGANPEIMLHFPKDYPNAVRVSLNVNYRSTPEILSAADRLIRRNKVRFEKKLRVSGSGGSHVEICTYDDPRDECIHLAKRLKKKHEEGMAYEKMAVLFRTNSEGREAVEQLMEYSVPFFTNDSVPCIYDHWIARNIFAYLEIGTGSRKRSDFLQICNKPNRYISRDAFTEEEVSFPRLFQYYREREWMYSRLKRFASDLQMIGSLPPYGALIFIRKEIGYEQFIREYAEEHSLPADDLIRILDELTESARNYESFGAWKNAVVRFREHVQMNPDKKGTGVALSTLHASKGLEYDSVYILDVNEGIIPYRRAVLDADKEEERRMLYVGMTRARKDLHLFSVRERYDKKLEPSHFLKDIGSVK